ncbi:Hypothetical predicted protein [Mytilus galloprovincialis]|uniref:Uncharacterized protein n=1 Tax=Mytilus galloprovincialis TaxID=29158 RepID=A0A8B6CL32_MYTGA|nr:Hypothetical predicted protein [Mytilus galloprovincialis]
MTADKHPFTFVGVDYFGPLNVKLGRNDRPITAISDDCRDLPVLTPNMLLLMKNNTSTPLDVLTKRMYMQNDGGNKYNTQRMNSGNVG